MNEKKRNQKNRKPTTARPLDGGVLTRWGARAPARGPATAQRTARSVFLARGCSVVAVFAAAEKRGRRRERESKGRMARVFQGAGRSELFDPRETAARPSDRDERPRFTGPTHRPRQARARAAFCQPRPRLRPGCGLCAQGKPGRAIFSAFWAALG